MPTRLLRPALVEDLEVLQRLVRDFYLHFGYPYSEPEKRRLLSRVLDEPSLGRISLVLSDEGDPVGYLYVAYYFSLELGGPAAILDELYIDPSHRGQGRGSQVVRQAIELARGLGLRALQIESERSNERATALYRRLGFLDLDRHLLTFVLVPDAGVKRPG